MRLPRNFCTVGGWQLAYATVGSGPSVLLLHGLGGTADFWQPIITLLAARYTLVCPDLLGFGYSDKPTIAYTLERHIEGVSGVLHAVGAGSLHAVVGHSVGGVIAVALLGNSVAQTNRLALAATPLVSPRFPIRQELLRHPLDRAMLTWQPLAQLVHHTFQLLWPVLRQLPVPPELRGAWAGYMDHSIPSYTSTAEELLFHANLDPLLPALRALPTLLLYGAADRTVPPIHARRLQEALPLSQAIQLAGGHYAVLTEGRAPLSAWLDANVALPPHKLS